VSHQLEVPARVGGIVGWVAPLRAEAFVVRVALVGCKQGVLVRIVAVERLVQAAKVQVEGTPAAKLVLVLEVVLTPRLGRAAM